MKHLKTYEEILITDNGPQIGDYVICRDTEKFLNDFLSTNIGQVIDDRVEHNTGHGRLDVLKNKKYFVRNYPDYFIYPIKYDNIPSYNSSDKLKKHFNNNNFRYMEKTDILFYSPNKEDCETFLAANKYNL